MKYNGPLIGSAKFHKGWDVFRQIFASLEFKQFNEKL